MIQSWQSQQWQQLMKAKSANRLPHALLFAGAAGSGKLAFTKEFARALLCQRKAEAACDCHACHLLAGKAHPNLLWVEPEKPGQAIKVDQIRDVADFVNYTSLQGEYRIVIINPANNLNISAANALLKTLEEPSAGAVLILMAEQYERLPATVISRCHRITFVRPSSVPLPLEEDMLALKKELFETLFQLSGVKGDALKAASNWQENDPLRLIDFMLCWSADLLRVQLDAGSVLNNEYASQFSEIKNRISSTQTLKWVDHLQRLRKECCLGINFNKQLLLENVLINWKEVANVPS